MLQIFIMKGMNFSSLPLKYLYWQCEKSVKGVANRTKSADIIIFINICLPGKFLRLNMKYSLEQENQGEICHIIFLC